jgi:predicted ATPase
MPDTGERVQHELLLQTTIGPALMAMKGYGAPEIERTYARARELCQQLGETPRLLRVLLGLETFYFIRGELHTARELAQQCFTLVQRADDPARLQQAHVALGSTLFHLGELPTARTHLEQGLALHDSHQPHGLPAVADPQVGCRAYASWTLWHLGHPDLALQRSREALSRSQELSHPHSLAFALHFASGIHHYRREAQVVQELAESAIALATKQIFPYWGATATIWRGWALAAQGQHEEGVAQIRQGLDAYRSTGAELGWPLFLALLAEAYRPVEQREEGLVALAEALTTAQRTGERWYEAELYRLRGESLWMASVADHAQAEACFCQALEVSRWQQAKAWELRAAMSLSQLWRQQGKRAEARQLLASVYGWFTEGFDTADLREAKVLLEELS